MGTRHPAPARQIANPPNFVGRESRLRHCRFHRIFYNSRMALESPMKKDVEKAGRELDALQRLYNIYFQGAEDEPPRAERRALDALIVKIKSQLAIAANASDKFQANTLVSRYQTTAARWDKTLRGIENGTIIRPKKRE